MITLPDRCGKPVILKQMLNHLPEHVKEYNDFFQSATSNSHALCQAYIRERCQKTRPPVSVEKGINLTK